MVYALIFYFTKHFIFRNNYKGHMEKTKGRVWIGREVGMAEVGGSDVGEM